MELIIECKNPHLMIAFFNEISEMGYGKEDISWNKTHHPSQSGGNRYHWLLITIESKEASFHNHPCQAHITSKTYILPDQYQEVLEILRNGREIKVGDTVECISEEGFKQ